MSSSLPPLVLTSGEPAGIGPDLCIDLALRPAASLPPIVVLADSNMLKARAAQMHKTLSLSEWQPGMTARCGDGSLSFIDCPLAAEAAAGKLDKRNAPAVIDMLDRAVDGCLDKRFSGMVTGPVQKSLINEAGIAFTGHTEYLADRSGCDQVVMMLATDALRVALVTTHLPLADVPRAITPGLLTRVITILHESLQTRYGLTDPGILVCGLNPHAGESGHLGREEIEVISPVLESLRLSGIRLTGPLPADTLFTPRHLDSADAVLAMYHDQGLPVLKFQGFGQAVNITLGLPFVRTSVDHGTALDLAGTGSADCGSLLAAIHQAWHMAQTADQTRQS